MPLDPSIAMGVKPIQIADPLAQYGQLAAIQNAQNQSRAAENQNALAQYTIAKARRDDIATEAMNELYSKHYNTTTGAVNQNALFQELAARNLGSKIPAIQTQLLEQQGKKTTIAKTEADTESSKFKLQQDKLEHGITSMASASTPQAALEKLNDGVKKGYFDQTTADAEAQKIQSLTPDQFQQYRTEKILGIMKATDQLNATAPKPSEINVGNKKIFIDLNPNSRTFKQEVAPAQTMSATPGEILRHQDAMARLAAESATGQLTPESIDLAAQLYAQTGTLPPLGIGKAAAGLKTQILNRASELTMGGGTSAADAASKLINTKQDVQSQAKAVKDFSTGLQSRQVTSFNTAIDHLATMDKLADALTNNDVKIFNTVANAFARQTGSPAPTNFDTAKTIVASEVAKAVSGSSMALKDREEIRDQILAARSPEQLKGATDTLKKLLGGQLNSLNLQYENSTGRKDFDKKLTPESQKTIKELRGDSNVAPANSGGFKYLGKE